MNGVNDSWAWSPDGTYAAFFGRPADSYTLYVAVFDGGDVASVQLLDEGEPEDTGYKMAWSPDSSRLAYVKYLPETGGRLGILSPDDPEEIVVVDNVSFTVQSQDRPVWPAWMDDDHLAYEDGGDPHVVTLDGPPAVEDASGSVEGSEAILSPDRSTISYVEEGAGTSERKLYVTTAAGPPEVIGTIGYSYTFGFPGSSQQTVLATAIIVDLQLQGFTFSAIDLESPSFPGVDLATLPGGGPYLVWGPGNWGLGRNDFGWQTTHFVAFDLGVSPPAVFVDPFRTIPGGYYVRAHAWVGGSSFF